ncbi:MAG: TetR/AcrR family transcriptional regulator [Bacteroidia bacterium]|nr:TetR/AcrR family transcriptional regulator [Bacteroidia bacterium]
MISVITKRESILSTAAILFRQKGYAATSMRELAEQVGMEAASLYNHISSKEEMLKSICFQVGESYLLHLTEVNQMQAGFREKIARFIHLHLAITIQNIAFVSVANHEWKHLKEENLKTFLEMRKTYEAGVKNILIKGMDSGDFRKMDPSITLYTLLSSLRWVEVWYKENRNISVQELEKNIEHFILNGLST